MLRPEFIVLLAAAVAIIAVVVGAVLYERRRRRALEAVAGDMGFTFARDDNALRGRMGIPLLQAGRAHQVRNLMRGHIEDLQVILFDYTFKTGSGKHTRTHRQTVAAFQVPRLLPSFALRPERFLDRITGAFGAQDIDFPDHPEFSRRFHLSSCEEEAVRQVFQPQVLSHFEQGERCCVESDGRWLAVYRAGRRVSPRDFPAFLEQAFEVCNRLA